MPRRKSLEPEDVAFLTEWVRQLKRKYENRDCTKEEFANRLEVKRQTLFDYLDGKFMPGLRTVYLAAENLGIRVPYGKYDASELVKLGRRKKNAPEAQMLLPFAIESLKPENIQIELGPKHSNSVGLALTIKFAS